MTNLTGQQRKSTTQLLAALSLSIYAMNSAGAADWGYDGSTPQKSANPIKPPAPADGLKATMSSQVLGAPAQTAKPKTATTAPTSGKATAAVAAPAHTAKSGNQPEQIDLHAARKIKEAKETANINAMADKERKTINAWLEVYTLVSQEKKLSDDQKDRYSKYLAKCVNGPEKASFEAINLFWPAVSKSMKANAEQKDNYRSLFKALFRLQMHNNSLSEQESNILSEILGPERIAVAGPPDLTEEALDAYGDMACFMYSQNNPGKTIDATDNRAIFSSVIQRKFTEAPSNADKLSMANFAIKWAKFKVLFSDANEAQKGQLVQQISGQAKGSNKADVPNPTVVAILTHGPWLPALNAMATAQKSANAHPVAKEKDQAAEGSQEASGAMATPSN